MRASFVIAGLASLVAACATYRTAGVPADTSKVAVLVHQPNAAEDVTIVELDGVSRGMGLFHRYELAPGDHVVTFGVPRRDAERDYLERAPVRFRAAAGRRYEVEVVLGQLQVPSEIHIVDADGGKRVDF